MSASERKIAELEAEVRKLKHLLSTQMRSGDTLWMESGVNEHGKPFVHLHWNEEVGQLTVEEQHGLHMLEVCEAADSDAAVFRFLTDSAGPNLPPEGAAAFIGNLREHRGGDRKKAA